MRRTPRQIAWILAKFITLLAFFVTLGYLAWQYDVPLADFLARTEPYGALTLWAAVVGLYAVVSVIPMPGRDLLKLLAAGLFSYWSIAAIWLGEMGAAILGFGLTRFGGHDLVRWLFGNQLDKYAQRLDRASWRSICVLRILPVTPYRYFNYAAGLVDLRFGPYLVGSAIGMFIRTAFYQILFALFAEELTNRGITLWETFVFSLILVPSLLVIWWVGARVKKALRPGAKPEPQP
jgi:uncharacterized membrane protein YdjX (TVP38/TMEM64 family)